MATGKTNAGGSRVYDFTGTAREADVLSGKTFFSTDPIGKQTGTMANKAGANQSAASEMASSQYRMRIPAAGYYDNSSMVYRTYAQVAADIGLTAAVLAKGNTVLGIAGEFVPTLQEGAGSSSVTFAANSTEMTVSITGLAFTPVAIRVGPAATSYTSYTFALAVRPLSGNSGIWQGCASATNNESSGYVKSATWGANNATVTFKLMNTDATFSTNPQNPPRAFGFIT